MKCWFIIDHLAMNTESINDKPIVTIIIATYNRPDVLEFAVRSVQLQTIKKWELLVIGDNCNDKTQSVMNQFLTDPRISYINIPRRTGCQALPNSAGMQVSKTRYLAFLNHDDIWLPDHLEIALGHLEVDKESNFYFARGYTPITRSVCVSGLDTMKILDPGTGKRAVVTDLSWSSNAAGTIAFYFEADNLIAQYFRQSSAQVASFNPSITAWESTMVAGGVFVVLGAASGTDGCYINLQGFITD